MDIARLRHNDVAILTWADIENAARLVLAQLSKAAFTPTVVIGIERGGCVPAVWFSNVLGVKRFDPINVRTTISDDVRAERLQVSNRSIVLPNYTNDRVLIVDDVTNTGATLRATREAVMVGGCLECRTAALYRDTVGAGEGVAVDFIGPSVHAWTLFTWER